MLCAGHRSGRVKLLGAGADFSARISGLPRTVALPLGLGGGALHVALLGMYWDISLHIDQGRDPGPLANPAHYLILIGLFGIFAAGVIAIVAARATRASAGARSVRIAEGWYAPVGGLLMAACGAFALTGFPLDDMWHRLFGQDVTLWGPTHLMLIGGAGMSLVGMAVLLRRGRRAPDDGDRRGSADVCASVGLMGGLLIGLSTFQGEFDFGVPQFRMVFHPLLIAFAAAFALTAARLWIGRGGALYAALFFLLIRGIVSLFVGPIFGEVTPTMALYLPEAILVEVAAVAFLKRRPLAFGAVSGVLVGTLGMAAEWGWTHVAFRLPWTTDILPEGVILAVVAGLAGGAFGVLLGTGLRGELVAAARRPPGGARRAAGHRRLRRRRPHRPPGHEREGRRRRPGRAHHAGHRQGRLVGDRDRLAGQGQAARRAAAPRRSGPLQARPPHAGHRQLEGDDPRPGRAADPVRADPPARRRRHPGQGRPGDAPAARVRRRQARPPARAEEGRADRR